ncbi:MAG: 3-oxoacyl-[acyl-carrier-protein] synthase III C-terminal domain-containing protein [Phycisphaerales bacterium]
MNALRRVAILGTGSFLPGPPVATDEIEAVLGELTEAPAAVRRFAQRIGPRIAEQSGVRRRHFAIDRATGRLTHDFTDLAREACVAAMRDASVAPEDVDLLVLAAPFLDHGTPPGSVVLQQKLGIERCAELSIHSNCSGVGKAVEVAFDALRTGRHRTAVVAYSQLSGFYLRAAFLHQPSLTRSQALLRWILSDGAGAIVLRGEDADVAGHELLGTHVESTGGSLPAAMTAGLGAGDLRRAACEPTEAILAGLHHLDQDFEAVDRLAVETLEAGTERLLARLGLSRGDIDHFVFSTPTTQLFESAASRREGIPAERIRFRCAESGYCGGAAVLVHLDEMARSGELRAGQRVVCASVESSKWMTGGFVARW